MRKLIKYWAVFKVAQKLLGKRRQTAAPRTPARKAPQRP